MNGRTRMLCVTLLVAVGGAVPLSALAESCPDKIVVGKRGDGTDEYAFFNRARIASAKIPTEPGAKYECTYESQSGMRSQPHGLAANELIKSVGTGWQKDGDAYACQLGQDCSFVTQKN
jgi:hypothetical protein